MKSRMRGLHHTVAVAIMLVVATAASLASGYRILGYDVELAFRPDSIVEVTETISVQLTEPRRGIIRDIPFRYQTRLGERRIGIENIQVLTMAGTSYPFRAQRSGRNWEVRIGQEDVVHDAGTNLTYVIRYEVADAWNFFDDMMEWGESAEFYWNAIGHDWDVSIGTPTVRLLLPAQLANQNQLRGFFGPLGSSEDEVTNEDFEVTPQGQLTEIIMPLPGELPRGHGATVILAVPAELIPRLTPVQRVVRAVELNVGPLLSLLLLPFVLLAWLKFGRNPKDMAVQVRFEPPEGLGPAEAGTMIDETVHPRDIGAGIVSLAVKGYLILAPVEKGKLRKTTELNLKLPETPSEKPLTDFEQELYKKIKRAAGKKKYATQVNLRKHVGSAIHKLHDNLYEELNTLGLYHGNPQKTRTTWGCSVLVVAVGLVFLGRLVSPMSPIWLSIIMGVGSLIMVSPLIGQMPLRTPKGHRIRQQVLGFRELLQKRAYFMEWMAQKHPTQVEFEEYLPYAVAFDCVEEWTSAFRDIVTAPPNWYQHPTGTVFLLTDFGSDFGAMVGDTARAASTPPAGSAASGGSSGFSSGGGFSGGGFGGGGGRSW